MNQKPPKVGNQERTEPKPRAHYEPPRILTKRPVEHVTLVTGDGGPGGGVGGE